MAKSLFRLIVLAAFLLIGSFVNAQGEEKMKSISFTAYYEYHGLRPNIIFDFHFQKHQEIAAAAKIASRLLELNYQPSNPFPPSDQKTKGKDLVIVYLTDEGDFTVDYFQPDKEGDYIFIKSLSLEDLLK